MDDQLYAGPSPEVKSDPATDSPSPVDNTWDVVSEQLEQLLPRLVVLSTRVAILAPVLGGIIDIDSFGRGIHC